MIIKSQIERLKRDLRSLEDYEQKLIDSDRMDYMKGIFLKKQYLRDHIDQLEQAA